MLNIIFFLERFPLKLYKKLVNIKKIIKETLENQQGFSLALLFENHPYIISKMNSGHLKTHKYTKILDFFMFAMILLPAHVQK